MVHVRMDVRKHFMAISATIIVLTAVKFKIAFVMELAGIVFQEPTVIYANRNVRKAV